jgi:hypothetical protein
MTSMSPKAALQELPPPPAQVTVPPFLPFPQQQRPQQPQQQHRQQQQGQQVLMEQVCVCPLSYSTSVI